MTVANKARPGSAGCVILVALVLAGTAAPGPALGQQQAQQAAQQAVGRPVGQGEILEGLKQSGLTREQARQRLQQAGHATNLLDPYFDMIEGGGAAPAAPGLPANTPAASADFLSALSSIGIVVPGLKAAVPAAEGAQEEPAQEEEVETLDKTASTAGGAPTIYGKSLFSSATTQFEPVTAGPVDPAYRLGPGDQIILILTGDVELAYTLDVTREGYIVIPDVGQIFVNGLTLAGLENQLFGRLGEVYSGVTPGPGATTHFHVSIGRLRTNQVFLIGDVERPGAYQVSSVATVFHALHAAGGPNERGSFRRVEVRRGGRVIKETDLYNYLLTGDSKDDIRLEQGDIVFVPLVGPRVTIAGQVRRSHIFELKAPETLVDALTFAGGLQADAYVERIQIDRILPPAERIPGRERVLIDVNLVEVAQQNRAVEMQDGDRIEIFGISDERRNRVTVRGEVFRPGVYEYVPGMKIWDLILRANGLLPDVYTPVAHLIRFNPVDGTYRLHRLALHTDSAGRPLDDFALQDLDEVVIYGRAALLPPRTVQVTGPVNRPGSYPYADGMTLKDLILAAGGTKPEFLPDRANISRLQLDLTRQMLRYELDPDSLGVPQTDIPLAAEDHIALYSRREMLLPQNVGIEGLVKKAGVYPLAEGMTLQDLLLAAGGFEKGAQDVEVEVARVRPGVTRSDTVVTVLRVPLSGSALLQKGSGSPAGESDVGAEPSAAARWRPAPEEFVLEDRDRVFVRRLPGFVETAEVSVSGEVLYPGSYALEKRVERLSSIIRRAGGVTKDAYVPGFRLLRSGTPVAVDLRRALRSAGSEHDMIVFPGDQLEVPRYDPTVLVTGAVLFESRVRYDGGKGLGSYLEGAGGLKEEADRGRVAVRYPNGEMRTTSKFLFFRNDPGVRPGSVIVVPAKSPEAQKGFDWDKFLTQILAVTSTMATLIIAVDRI